MKKLIKRVILLLSIPVTAVVTYYYAGTKIFYSETPPQSCDYIFTFGMSNDRYVYSEQLFLSYGKPQWIISDPVPYISERMINKGYGSDKIHAYFEAQSTYDEVKYLQRFIKEHGLSKETTIVLVSASSHLGRIKLLCKKLGLEKMVQITYCAVPKSVENPPTPSDYKTHWWRYNTMRREAFNLWATAIIHWW